MADLKIAPEEIYIWGLDAFPEGEDHSDLEDPERLDLPVSEELIRSIDAHGVITPVMVRAVQASKWRTFRKSKNDRAYIAIDGRQRIRAAREINIRRKDAFPVLIPYVIRDLAEAIAPLAPGIANTCHQEDSPLQSARRIVRLQARGYALEDMRGAFPGFPQVQTLRNWLALLKVVPELVPKLGAEISWSDGYALGRMSPTEQRSRLSNAQGTEAHKQLEKHVMAVPPDPAANEGYERETPPTERPARPARQLPSERASTRPSLGSLKVLFAKLEPGEADEADADLDLAAEVLRFVITGQGDFTRWPTVAERIQ